MAKLKIITGTRQRQKADGEMKTESELLEKVRGLGIKNKRAVNSRSQEVLLIIWDDFKKTAL